MFRNSLKRDGQEKSETASTDLRPDTDTGAYDAGTESSRDITEIIMENSDVRLAYLDREFNFIRVNSAFARSSGHNIDELIGRNFFEILPDEEIRIIFEQARDTGLPFKYQDQSFQFIDQPYGDLTRNDWTLTPVTRSTGGIEGLVLILPDTTEQKRLNQLKDEFIGLISHELRSPLTVIMGAISTALNEADRLSPDETRQLLQDAVLETESLSHLLGNLLELSRAQADRLLLHVESIDIGSIIYDTVERVKRQTALHRFMIDIPPGLPTISADQLRLVRILYNLLENAVKYSPHGGDIGISVRPDGEGIIIAISDQGVGLSPSDQERIFGPFQRLEDSGFGEAGGVGLGLVVCHRLIEIHGGKIWVESSPGQGSTFFFFLPSDPGQTASPAKD
jgi:PAS domain S-box-containing protein